MSAGMARCVEIGARCNFIRRKITPGPVSSAPWIGRSRQIVIGGVSEAGTACVRGAGESGHTDATMLDLPTALAVGLTDPAVDVVLLGMHVIRWRKFQAKK